MLEREDPGYQDIVVNDIEQLARTLRKGDVVSVEGRV